MSTAINLHPQSKPATVRKILLSVLLTILIYILITMTVSVLNFRKTPGLKYDESLNSYVFSTEFREPGSVCYLSDNWIFVPNITAKTVSLNHYSLEALTDRYPYASNVSISSRSGWNDLGANAEWHNTDEPPKMNQVKNGVDYFCSGLYVTQLAFTKENPTVLLSIPEINGTAYVYCNDRFEGIIGDNAKTHDIDFSFGYSSIPIRCDNGGEALVIIAVSADSRLADPGILSSPALEDKVADTKSLVISAGWFWLIFALVPISIIGGIILAKTFHDRSRLYFLIALEFIFMFYLALDGGYYTTMSFAKTITMNVLFVLLAILSYFFEASLYSEAKEQSSNILFRFDRAVIALAGVVIILINIRGRSIIDLTVLTGINVVYALTVATLSFIKILFYHIKDKNAIFGLESAITFLFMFLSMYDASMKIYNIPVYSTFFLIAFVAIEILIMRNYVHQYRFLENTSEKLRYAVKEKTQYISEINRDLLRTNKKLMENEEARKNVLSNVSHDLRTPITAIRGYAELLMSARKNMKDDQIETYLQNIIKRSTQMERIVSDIVELTRMESNTNEFQFTDVSMAELLDELYMMYEGDLRGTEKRLEIELPETDLLITKADPKKISRVFENLISNAINYTYDEAVIKIKAWREGADLPIEEQRIHITVSDNGIGIPEEEIANIFDRFYRAKNSGKNIKGTGLGLSIVKTITDHHDAEITVTSALGTGTEFHIVMKATY